MLDLCRIIFGIVVDLFRPRGALQAEILVLRQQIIVLRRDKGCYFWPSTGWLWVGSASCSRRPARRSPSFGLIPLFAGIAQASDVTAGGNRGLCPGRPVVPAEIRQLIRQMSVANPWWGAPRIHGQLLKLGIAARVG